VTTFLCFLGDIGERYAHQVRLTNPNAFGLYDMHDHISAVDG
jgi:hypothetical protein